MTLHHWYDVTEPTACTNILVDVVDFLAVVALEALVAQTPRRPTDLVRAVETPPTTTAAAVVAVLRAHVQVTSARATIAVVGAGAGASSRINHGQHGLVPAQRQP